MSAFELSESLLQILCVQLQVNYKHVYIKMTSLSHLGTLRREIDELEAEVLDTKKALTAAQAPADTIFWRQQLGHLNKKEIILREQGNILLQAQMSGEQWLLRCLLSPLC